MFSFRWEGYLKMKTYKEFRKLVEDLKRANRELSKLDNPDFDVEADEAWTKKYFEEQHGWKVAGDRLDNDWVHRFAEYFDTDPDFIRKLPYWEFMFLMDEWDSNVGPEEIKEFVFSGKTIEEQAEFEDMCKSSQNFWSRFDELLSQGMSFKEAASKLRGEREEKLLQQKQQNSAPGFAG